MSLMSTKPIDLSELLEQILETIIEETPNFDDRIRKQVQKVLSAIRMPSSNLDIEKCYGLCLDILEGMRKTQVTGNEWAVMNGVVEFCKGLYFCAKDEGYKANKSYQDSEKHFKSGNCVKGEILAAVGLAQSYHRHSNLPKANEHYNDAFTQLNRQNLDFALRQLQRELEKILEEIQAELTAVPVARVPKPPRNVSRYAKPLAIYGEVKAGYPGFMNESPPEDWYIVDDRLTRGAEFGYLVKGDSMIDAGIREGDYVFVRPQQADLKPSEIAVVVITDQNEEREEALKHVELRDDHWYLRSRNETIKPRIVVPQESEVSRIVDEYTRRNQEVEPVVGKVEIIGKVVAVLRSLT